MPDQRLADLLADVWDGSLDAADRRELERLLATDPGALAAAVDDWRLHRQLPLVLREPQGDWFAAGVRRALNPDSGRFVMRLRGQLRRSRRATRPRPFLAPALLVAALVVLAIGAWWVWSVPPPAPQAQSWAQAPALPAGVQASGAGRIEAGADGIWHLRQGSLSFEVSRGTRFAVASDQARVEVLDTRFTLSLEAGVTRLAVAAGLVRFTAGGATTEIASGGSAAADARGLLPGAVAWAWRPTGEAGAFGTPCAGGLRSRENPEYAGNGLIRSPDQGRAEPLLPVGGTGILRLRSLADGEQTVALLLVLRDADTGYGFPWKCQRVIGPGAQELAIPLAELRRDQGVHGPPALRVSAAAVLSWGAGPEAVELQALELRPPSR